MLPTALQKGDCSPANIRAYLSNTRKYLTKLALYKDDTRMRRCAVYTEQLEAMEATVLKRGDAITDSSE